MTSAAPLERSGRAGRVCSRLADERSGRVVFVSHCLLNENTRYPGGAFRPGAVEEVVGGYLAEGVGICQLPCPEQLAWGGVLKRHMLALCGRPGLAPTIGFVAPLLTAYTSVRYRFLARRVARQISDYQRSGFVVVGVVGVDASPTCGVTTTLDIDASLGALVRCPIDQVDRRYMNDAVVGGAVRPGRGLFIGALDRALAARGRRVPLLAHDLRSEMPASPLPPGPVPAGMAGAHTPSRPPRSVVTATRAVLRRRLGEQTAREVVTQARARFGELASRIPPKLNPGGRHLLTQSAFTIAVHRALIERGTEPDLATSLVADVVFEANRSAHRWLHRIAGLRHRDPWDRLRWQSRLLCRFYYAPPAWELHEVPVPGGHGLDITRCAIADYYRALGLGELCEGTICVQDARVADQYGTPVGISFTRTGTLAGGADQCDFRYRPAPTRPDR